MNYAIQVLEKELERLKCAKRPNTEKRAEILTAINRLTQFETLDDDPEGGGGGPGTPP